ncbi:alkaline phosphatase [Aquirufa ecclesiirivi]|uniref:Alkaline phosphatase n=1 Tax=Aquirufa ecclesiirivi TaxID=2715124 RepID=A0ABT4JEL0_9BACT|nr:alkaline phosphatase [Aquirufa ecclesiirivi]MCZ2474708.1 alkaline phosphatase [Aquirufa ecclesiirivi]
MKKVISISFLYLLAITAFGQSSTIKYPKNIIFLIGDGMGVSQIYAGLTANKGHLALERIRHIGFHKNQASDNYVTDSAAGATAFSTGKKTYNGAIGVDATQTPQVTLLELAEKKGMATGLVSTADITDATPAAFIAHQIKRNMHDEIAKDFLKTDVDIVVGGGRKSFDQRKDGQNLLDSLKSKKYQVVESQAEMNAMKQGKFIYLYAPGDPIKMSEGRGDILLDATNKSMELLSKNKKGFFVMIEGGQIDWGGHANDTNYAVSEMVDFNKSIEAALNFAEKDKETLVLITADHETGGMALLGGDMTSGEVKASFITKGHTGQMVPVFAYGPGSEAFQGIYQNTAIFDKLKAALRLSQK